MHRPWHTYNIRARRYYLTENSFVLLKGAFCGILVGHACGITRLILDLVYTAPPCGTQDNRPAIVSKLHYTYFGQLNFIVTATVIVAVSLLTEPPVDNQVGGPDGKYVDTYTLFVRS